MEAPVFIPLEIVVNIFRFLGPDELEQAMLVSRQWLEAFYSTVHFWRDVAIFDEQLADSDAEEEEEEEELEDGEWQPDASSGEDDDEQSEAGSTDSDASTTYALLPESTRADVCRVLRRVRVPIETLHIDMAGGDLRLLRGILDTRLHAGPRRHLTLVVGDGPAEDQLPSMAEVVDYVHPPGLTGLGLFGHWLEERCVDLTHLHDLRELNVACEPYCEFSVNMHNLPTGLHTLTLSGDLDLFNWRRLPALRHLTLVDHWTEVDLDLAHTPALVSLDVRSGSVTVRGRAEHLQQLVVVGEGVEFDSQNFRTLFPALRDLSLTGGFSPHTLPRGIQRAALRREYMMHAVQLGWGDLTRLTSLAIKGLCVRRLVLPRSITHLQLHDCIVARCWVDRGVPGLWPAVRIRGAIAHMDVAGIV